MTRNFILNRLSNECMHELIAYLNIIKPLSPAIIERIKKIFKLRKFVKSSFVLREGDQSDPVIFVLSGLLRYYKIERSSEVSKCFLQRHDILINGTGIAAGVPSSGFMQALINTEVLICPKLELDYLYIDFPEFEHHGRILTQLSYIRVYAVLDNIRMRTARERYQFLQREFPGLVLAVPNKHLASYLGINKITLSRIRSIR